MTRPRLADYAFATPVPPVRGCDHPGCPSGGEYRAPRSRAALQHFYWFCLDHVRAYNAAWNYYQGMSAAEVEAEIRNDTVWQRPSWPLGGRVGMTYWPHFRDYGLFGLDEEDSHLGHQEKPNRPLSQQQKALAIFRLEPPFTLVGLKARYKELVKLHHPDVHGGDKAAEERLKVINLAYATLKTAYFA
ncbi:MAG TPA: J domain-containing protein [Stellaceae bacterium]|nr:J domain-containing protein [Stellaceae bacterium]